MNYLTNKIALILIAASLLTFGCKSTTGGDDGSDLYGVWADGSDGYLALTEDTWTEVYYDDLYECYDFDHTEIVSISSDVINLRGFDGTDLTVEYNLDGDELFLDIYGDRGTLTRSDMNLNSLSPECE